jgi:hypothetical protein
MALATDPSSMISLIDHSIAAIVAGLIGETNVQQRQSKMLDIEALRRTRQYYVLIRNQTQPPTVADVSEDRQDQGPNTTDNQPWGPTR